MEIHYEIFKTILNHSGYIFDRRNSKQAASFTGASQYLWNGDIICRSFIWYYKSVKEAGSFLIEIMPVMFIPAGVGLMSSWLNLKPVIIPVCIITVVAIFTVMLVSGHVTQYIVKHSKNKDEF